MATDQQPSQRHNRLPLTRSRLRALGRALSDASQSPSNAEVGQSTPQQPVAQRAASSRLSPDSPYVSLTGSLNSAPQAMPVPNNQGRQQPTRTDG